MAKRRPVSKTTRFRVFARDHYQCVYVTPKGRCPVKGSPTDFSQLTIEHILPIWLGGSNRESNLETMCRFHNNEREREVAYEQGVRHRPPNIRLPKDHPLQERVREFEVVRGSKTELVAPEGYCPTHGRWKSRQGRCPGCPPVTE